VSRISPAQSGIKPSATTVTPSLASAAARNPLKLPLVHTMRQGRPQLASAASAISRLMLGGE
jgi:hypothetical protein